MAKENFFCKQKCGTDFNIHEWNKAWDYCIKMNLNEKQTSEILEGKKCEEQCFDCCAMVGKRQRETSFLTLKKHQNDISVL